MDLNKTLEKIKTSNPVKIVAFGDSLTSGWMVNKGYIDFLSEMLKKKYPKSRISIINRGIPGNTAKDGLYRLHTDVIDENPDLIFIQFGLNDAYLGYNPEKFYENISEIIEKINDKIPAEILLITSIAFDNEKENNFIDIFYKCLKNISEHENIPIANVHEYWTKSVANEIVYDDLVQFDRVHPTVLGYRLMAEAIMDNFS